MSRFIVGDIHGSYDRNYAALPAPAISSLTTESDDHGTRVNIVLTDDSVISLFCSFE